LLINSSGKFWRFLPHDEISPPGSLEKLVNALKHNKDAILAYGPTKGLALNGSPFPEKDRLNPHPFGEYDRWTFGGVLPMFWSGFFDSAFKGLIRRDIIMKNRVLIYKTWDNIFPERCWLFALCLLGRFHYVPDALYEKRIYHGSVSSHWEIKGIHVMSAAHTMCKYLFTVLNNDRNWQYGSRDIWMNGRTVAAWIDHKIGDRPSYDPFPDYKGIRTTPLPGF
jgi:hypothetical protein